MLWEKKLMKQEATLDYGVGGWGRSFEKVIFEGWEEASHIKLWGEKFHVARKASAKAWFQISAAALQNTQGTQGEGHRSRF